MSEVKVSSIVSRLKTGPEDFWRTQVVCRVTRSGIQMEPKLFFNILTLLRYHYDMRDIFAYKKSEEALIVLRPIGHDDQGDYPRSFDPTDVMRVRAELERIGMRPSAKDVKDAIKVVAKENAID